MLGVSFSLQFISCAVGLRRSPPALPAGAPGPATATAGRPTRGGPVLTWPRATLAAGCALRCFAAPLMALLIPPPTFPKGVLVIRLDLSARSCFKIFKMESF